MAALTFSVTLRGCVPLLVEITRAPAVCDGAWHLNNIANITVTINVMVTDSVHIYT